MIHINQPVTVTFDLKHMTSFIKATPLAMSVTIRVSIVSIVIEMNEPVTFFITIGMVKVLLL